MFTLSFYIGSSQIEDNTFLPKKEAITRLLEQNTPNLRYLACVAGTYVR